MVEQQRSWRDEKEKDFEKSTADISYKIHIDLGSDGEPMEDENSKLEDHYEKLKEQIASSESIFKQQIEEKETAVAELRGPLQEKIKSQTDSLEKGIFKYQEENERLTRELPDSKKKLKSYKSDMSDLNKSIDHKTAEQKQIKELITKRYKAIEAANKIMKEMKAEIKTIDSAVEEEKSKMPGLEEQVSLLKAECETLSAQILG